MPRRELVEFDRYGRPSIADPIIGMGPGVRVEGGQWVRKKHKKGDSSKKTSSVAAMPATPAAPVGPQPPAQPVTAVEPIPTVGASSIPESAAATAPIASTSAKTTDPTSITSATFAWTAAQDAVLIGMCIQHKTWGEIGEALPEKGMGEIQQRYNYLHLKYHGVPAVEEKDVKGVGATEEVVTGEAVQEEKGSDKDEEPAGKGKGKEKAKGGGKAKGKGGETKAAPSSSKGKGKEKVAKKVRIASPEVSEASDDGSDSIYPNDSDTYSTDTDESAIDPGDFPRGWTRPANFQRYRKGVLQVVEVDPDEQEPVQIGGKPIVYVQPEDNLDEEMLQTLFQLTKKNDNAKWLEVASRFFDKTGKRMDPALLKAMLKNL